MINELRTSFIMLLIKPFMLNTFMTIHYHKDYIVMWSNHNFMDG